ncbi:MAG: helix-turn-helix domain-containing protein [Abditibacteriaceae bacterium]
MDEVFKALADAGRRDLLDRLHEENGQTLSQLCADLQISRQAVSKHLIILEEAKLIVTIWQGRQKLHYLNPAPLHKIYEHWIAKYERNQMRALYQLKKAIEDSAG